MNHADLVAIARKRLKVYERCPIVITEMVTGAGETPDAIGWLRTGLTIVIECKATRSDFMADAKKYFRRNPERGMGAFRYYLAPAGMLHAEEIPSGWGLLEVTAKGVAMPRVSHAPSCLCQWGHHESAFEKRSIRGETTMLVSLIRRLAGPGVRGRATVDIAAYENDEHGNRVIVEQSELSVTALKE